MMYSDALRHSLSALRASKIKTVLSLLGIAVGISAALLLMAISTGAKGYVKEQFLAFGSHLLAVLPGKTETTGGIPGIGGVPNDLTVADAQAIKQSIHHARFVAPVSAGTELLSHGARSRSTTVFGSTATLQPIRDLRVRVGRFLPDIPWERRLPVIVLGSKVAREVFPGMNPVGQKVRLGSWRLRVIGVLEPQGVHLGINMNETVFVPVAMALRMFDQTSLFRVALSVSDVSDIERTSERVKAILRQRHGEEDFTVVSQDAMLSSFSAVLDKLTLALLGISAISLLVAGVGIMNVMLIGVAERGSEIGLLKALGATGGQVRLLFLLEAAAIAGAGGVLGILMGFGGVSVLRFFFPAYPASLPLLVIPLALVSATLVGILFGSLPARRAMQLLPIVALRGGHA